MTDTSDQGPPFASSPRYARLGPRPCGAALMIADRDGAPALLDLAATAPELAARATVLLVGCEDRIAARVRALKPASLTEIASMSLLDPALDRALDGARMGLQVWLAGSGGLIAQAQARLAAAGLPFGAIQAEHRGTAARRMQCVHCKTLAEDVTTDPYTCPGCGRSLYVRDHFSRRLGAFQGVCVDAETPGDVPEAVEIRL